MNAHATHSAPLFALSLSLTRIDIFVADRALHDHYKRLPVFTLSTSRAPLIFHLVLSSPRTSHVILFYVAFFIISKLIPSAASSSESNGYL